MFEEFQIQIIPWVLFSLLLIIVEDTSSTVIFSENLKICENETKDISGNKLVRCSNFIDFPLPLCVESRFRCNFVPDCPFDTLVGNATANDEIDCVKQFCNFEDNTTCGWNLTTISPTRGTWYWTLSPAIHGNLVGPPMDHTFLTSGTGHFIIADLTAARAGNIAVFKTPNIGSSDDQCSMEYYYYIRGGTQGKLQINQTYNRLNSLNSWNTTHELYTKNLSIVPANETDKWIKHSISWPKNEFYFISFSVILPTTAETSLHGAIAIDDIRFINCTKDALGLEDPFGPICPVDMFNCMESNNVLNCVTQIVVCDSVHDCPSGMDETYCTCDDYPFDFCPFGECYINNDTMKPTCFTISSSNSKSEFNQLLNNLTVVVIVSGGVVAIFIIIAFVVYKLFWQRKRYRNERESFEYGYDVTFFTDTAQLHTRSRVSSSLQTVQSNNSYSNLLILDKEWGLVD